jgi:hypothetical protein
MTNEIAEVGDLNLFLLVFLSKVRVQCVIAQLGTVQEPSCALCSCMYEEKRKHFSLLFMYPHKSKCKRIERSLKKQVGHDVMNLTFMTGSNKKLSFVDLETLVQMHALLRNMLIHHMHT